MPTCLGGVNQDQTLEAPACCVSFLLLLLLYLTVAFNVTCLFTSDALMIFLERFNIQSIRHTPSHALISRILVVMEKYVMRAESISMVPRLVASNVIFHLHMRCADSLLRGLVNKSHHHKLFYLANNAELRFRKGCRVCMRDGRGEVGDHFYNCVECGWRSHFKCLGIPESVFKKSYHIHPLVCKIFSPDDDDSLEYCGVCETMVHVGHHAYCCLECGFVSHIECILHEVNKYKYIFFFFTVVDGW